MLRKGRAFLPTPRGFRVRHPAGCRGPVLACGVSIQSLTQKQRCAAFPVPRPGIRLGLNLGQRMFQQVFVRLPNKFYFRGIAVFWHETWKTEITTDQNSYEKVSTPFVGSCTSCSRHC